MRFLYPLAILLIVFGASSCKKNKTDVSTGREYMARLAPQIQHFSGVQKFTGEGGTSIRITGPFYSLATGDFVQGTPNFKLIEYSSPKEMMFAGLSTTSENHILETGGAFSVLTEIDGVPVRPIFMAFHVPNSIPQNEMSVFYGDNGSESFWVEAVDTFGVAPLSGLNWMNGDTIAGDSVPGYAGYVYPLNDWFSEQGFLYINCDHFPGLGLPLTHVTVRVSADSEINPFANEVSLLFQDIQTYMPGQWGIQSDGFIFHNVPIGYDVTCLAVGVDNSQELFFGMLDFTIGEDGVYTFNMESISEEDLDDILNGL